MTDEEKFEGRMHGPQAEPDKDDPLPMRFVYMIILWLMLSLANTILTVAMVVQFILMALNKGHPNERLGDFGTDLGIWIAKAARYQTGASPVKPWPWTELD